MEKKNREPLITVYAGLGSTGYMQRQSNTTNTTTMKAIQQCLIIDDDEDDREIFLMCVNRISDHIRCSMMNTGVEAVALLQADESYSPEYIFIDMNMPKMNGMECLKHIRAIGRLGQSQIFMYSTTSETSVVNQAKALGATDFIIKPAKTAELREKLSAIFNIASVTEPGPDTQAT